MRRCLRRGHLSAAAVLTVPGDSAALPANEVVETLLDSSPAVWSETRVNAGGFVLSAERVPTHPQRSGEL
jgi:2-dehydro-3-deoxygluconokinase